MLNIFPKQNEFNKGKLKSGKHEQSSFGAGGTAVPCTFVSAEHFRCFVSLPRAQNNYFQTAPCALSEMQLVILIIIKKVSYKKTKNSRNTM